MKAGYLVLAADFHVHSFPGDGAPAAVGPAVEARRRRLDAIALTNHNSMHSWRLARVAVAADGRPRGALLIPGRGADRGRLITSRSSGSPQPVAWRQSAASAAAAAFTRREASPSRRIPTRSRGRTSTMRPLRRWTASRSAHPIILVSDDSRRQLRGVLRAREAVHPSIAAIGSSDFHHFAPLGLGRTYLFVSEATQAGILDAIRAGRTVACDGLGEAYGPPELVAMVGEDCRRDAALPPDGETPRIASARGWSGSASWRLSSSAPMTFVSSPEAVLS